MKKSTNNKNKKEYFNMSGPNQLLYFNLRESNSSFPKYYGSGSQVIKNDLNYDETPEKKYYSPHNMQKYSYYGFPGNNSSGMQILYNNYNPCLNNDERMYMNSQSFKYRKIH
jgi:hypothetical protein